MYREFYGLTKKPFHTTPDPSFLFLSPSHKEALAAILYGIEHRKGFVAITGEVGVGKTTIVRSFLEQVDWKKDLNHLIYIYNPNLTVNELLQSILTELVQEPIGGTDDQLVKQLQQFLIEKYRKRGTIVLLIDEAQNMPPRTLEHLRMLSNLETATDKLIQIILIGQPELEALLQQHDLRQLRQRIAVWATIHPLSKQESFDYITHRLVQAGLTGKPIFHKNALKLIVNQAAGIPRRLNILCDNALLTGLGHRQNPISDKIAREVIADVDKQPANRWWAWRHALGGILVFILGATWMVSIDKQDTIHTVNNDEVEAVATKITVINTPSDDLIPKNDDIIPSSTFNEQNVFPEISLDMPMNQQGAIRKRLSSSISDHQTGIVREGEMFVNNKPNVLHTGQKDETGTFVGTAPQLEDSTRDKVKKATLVAGTISTEPEQDNLGPSNLILTQSVAKNSNQPPRPGTFTTKPLTTRIIKEGDRLSSLVRGIYGSLDPEHVKYVLKHNPHIKHAGEIFPGQEVIFPRLAQEWELKENGRLNLPK